MYGMIKIAYFFSDLYICGIVSGTVLFLVLPIKGRNTIPLRCRPSYFVGIPDP
jgi:hypothetical protein